MIHGIDIFVLMPFAPDFENVYYAIAEVARQIGATVERADHPVGQERITVRILESIRNARLVIADISIPNPNVFYEVGFAHAIGKPVFLMTRGDIASIPFDIKDYNVFRYDVPVNVGRLEKDLKPLLAGAHANAKMSLTGPLTRALESVERIRPTNDLFATVVGVCLAEVADKTAKWASGEIRVGPSETIDKGIEVFHHLAKGGFATRLVKIDDYWNENEDYFEECRKAARKKLEISRVFILSDIDSTRNKSLRRHIEQDHLAGIMTFIALDSAVSDKDSVRDFGIWDDQVVCLVETHVEQGRSVPSGCTFSKTAAELASARRWRTSILQAARPAEEVLEELRALGESQLTLRASAEMMAQESTELCHGDVVDRRECCWYHSAWQYLRILDVVSTPDWHSDFFRTAIAAALPKTGRAHALICSTADYGMLEHLWSVVKELSDARIDITVVDLCPTPLRMCSWYSKRYGFHINYEQADALDLHRFGDSTFDLIVTDAFLTRFTGDEKKQVVSNWQRILKVSGQVVTTARIGAVEPKVVGSTQDVERFARRALENLRHERWLPLRQDELAPLVRTYAERIVSYPFRDARELASLFENGGFKVLKCAQKTTKGELHPNTEYCQLVATRPSPPIPLHG